MPHQPGAFFSACRIAGMAAAVHQLRH